LPVKWSINKMLFVANQQKIESASMACALQNNLRTAIQFLVFIAATSQ